MKKILICIMSNYSNTFGTADLRKFESVQTFFCLEQELRTEILVSEYCQIAGALGAALIGQDTTPSTYPP
ncbi:MAG: hypothetical protein WA125_14390 [Desulfosporosinus sp.]